MINWTRRQFISNSALAAASAAVLGRAGASSASAQTAARPNTGIKWDKAPCRFCGTGCHVRVGVRDGKVVAIQGDQMADVNRGLLCMKGYHVGGILYGKDRLTHPMVRRDGRLERISWEEAIDTIAERIMQAPERFAIYGSGQWTIPEGYAAQKLIKAGLANNNIEPNARLCMASAVTGYLSVYGVDEPAGCYDDLDACDVLIMWGNNPAEMHPVLFSRVLERQTRGEKIRIIDISTRWTRTSEFADDFIEFKPQGDLAILLGLCHLLVKQGKWDRDFVEKHCNFRTDTEPHTLLGRAIEFDDYRRLLEEYTPAKVRELSGVAPEKLQMLADLFANRELRITSLWCMGVNQHTRGTAVNRLLHGVHLLSGHFGKPGDAPTSLTGQPSACGTAREVGTFGHGLPGGRAIANAADRAECEKMWNVPEGRIKAEIGPHTSLMWEKFCTPSEDGGDIATLWVQVTNPGQTLPDLHRTFTGKRGLEDKFLIVSDVYPTATTELADLILPAAMWVEKNGIYGNSERRTQQWFKMVEPPGEARPDVWMTLAVARRVYELGHPGMKDKDGNYLLAVRDDSGKEAPAWEWEQFGKINVDRALYEEYRPFTFKKRKDVAPYDELVKSRGLRWPVVKDDGGQWREVPFRFMEFSDPNVAKGKGIQFYQSVTSDDRALIWFCAYAPAVEVPDADYPFWLDTGRVIEHWHSGTMTGRIPQLRNAAPMAYVEMHPEDASKEGLRNGELVVVETRRGKLTLPLWINGRGKPQRGACFIPFFDEKLLVNEITLGAVDPISRQPDYKKCAARIYRAPAATTASLRS
jgi:nitrate reductase (cytochrome)